MFAGRKVAYVENLQLKQEIAWHRKHAGVREAQMGRLEAQYGDALSRLREFDPTDGLVWKAQH